MPRDARRYLEDVQSAAQAIARFTAGKSFADSTREEMMRAAVERKFTLIGEAIAQLDRTRPDVAAQITDYKGMIGFRIVLMHRYPEIDDDEMWATCQSDSPILLREIEVVPGSLDSSSD